MNVDGYPKPYTATGFPCLPARPPAPPGRAGRRTALAPLAAVGAATPDAGADATLIARAREYPALDVQLQRMKPESAASNDIPDNVWNPLMDRSNAALDAVTDLPATTIVGWKAKGAVLATAIRADICHPEREHVLAISLACDLTGDDIEQYLPEDEA